MACERLFHVDDMFCFNNINVDPYTATFSPRFYNHYMTMWPEMCVVHETVCGLLAGYMIGKAEGRGDEMHGHVSAVTVAPEYRRQGVAKRLMAGLERSSQSVGGYFTDLFVRSDNESAVQMYKNLDYVIYRTIKDYYGVDKPDAYDMRKPTPRDLEIGSTSLQYRDGRTPEVERGGWVDYEL
ncbi:hypothetical protein KIPB_002110 [Kipferlia bialata]|uniref:N-acetyltransferase domain-containing protein n=1 Tax=Kipferlia bialata TaxID=797122 RepID=A0A9K3CS65_9EUKA|nr:hypothetical protein KIPB_002110 [Kipferlia bialata]|eukprot:g2110.t1